MAQAPDDVKTVPEGEGRNLLIKILSTAERTGFGMA
jgi:hypothetical protein